MAKPTNPASQAILEVRDQETQAPLPPAPPTTPEDPDARRARRLAQLQRPKAPPSALSRRELQEYLSDTIDPLSGDERRWMAAYIQHSGDQNAIAKAAGLTPGQVRAIYNSPRLRRAVGRSLNNIASPEALIGLMAQQALGGDLVSEYHEDGSPKRIDHATKQRAAVVLMQARGQLLDSVVTRHSGLTDEQLDSMLEAELARVKGLPTGQPIATAQLVESTEVTVTSMPSKPDDPTEPGTSTPPLLRRA